MRRAPPLHRAPREARRAVRSPRALYMKGSLVQAPAVVLEVESTFLFEWRRADQPTQSFKGCCPIRHGSCLPLEAKMSPPARGLRWFGIRSAAIRCATLAPPALNLCR